MNSQYFFFANNIFKESLLNKRFQGKTYKMFIEVSWIKDFKERDIECL